MLGFDARAAKATWTAAAVLLLLYAVYEIRETIFVLILSILFAYMLAPLVDRVSRAFSAKSNAWALAFVYLAMVSVLSVLVALIGTRVAEEATSLAARAPEFLDKLSGPTLSLPLPASLKAVPEEWITRLRGMLTGHSGEIASWLTQATLKLLSFSSYLIFLILVPILSFFLLRDGEGIRENFLAAIPEGQGRVVIGGILQDTHVLLGRYVRAVALLCLNTFVVFAAVFALAGVPYGSLLAAVALPLEFIPMLGPLAAAVIILTVTAVSGYSHVIWIAVFLGVFRMAQDYVLSPRLMSAGVEVHPLLVILGVLAGDKLGGVPGMLLSVPVIALLRVIYLRIVAARRVPGSG